MYGRSMPLVYGLILIRVGIYQGGSFRLIHRIIGRQWGKESDRLRELERDCLEISVMSGRSMPLVFGIFLARAGIYQGGSSAPYTSNYRVPREKRARSTEETCARVSGNTSYFRPHRACRFRDFPDRRMHLPGRFCFALYIEL